MKEWLKQIWNFIPLWLRNRYSIALLVFFILLLFFNDNTLFRLADRRKNLNDLKQQERYMNEELQQLKEQKKAFENDEEALEKFAREEYYMKKDSEDIFIIIDE